MDIVGIVVVITLFYLRTDLKLTDQAKFLWIFENLLMHCYNYILLILTFIFDVTAHLYSCYNRIVISYLINVYINVWGRPIFIELKFAIVV